MHRCSLAITWTRPTLNFQTTRFVRFVWSLKKFIRKFRSKTHPQKILSALSIRYLRTLSLDSDRQTRNSDRLDHLSASKYHRPQSLDSRECLFRFLFSTVILIMRRSHITHRHLPVQFRTRPDSSIFTNCAQLARIWAVSRRTALLRGTNHPGRSTKLH
jgi:hypothetical protein